MLTLTRYDDPAAFYERCESFWAAREAEHCLSIGIADSVVRTPSFYTEPPYLAAVTNDADEVILTALRTPPRDVILSHVDDPAALDLLIDDLAAVFDTINGVQGDADSARLFAERWSAKMGATYRLEMSERIYQINAVIPVSGVSGFARRAGVPDRDRVVDWLIAFEVESFGTAAERPRHEDWFDRGIVSDVRGIYVWEDEGEITSFVGHGGPTPHGMRIGPVYTPPEKRGRGYASALTAYVSQMLLDGGRQFCFLYTDLNNPTSNKIYQQIGYKPVIDCAIYRFGEA